MRYANYVNWLAYTLSALLLALAALHLYWGLGGLWPGRDEADLVSRVVGSRSAHMPSLLMSAQVAIALAAAAWIVAAHAGAPRFHIPGILWTVGFWSVFAVFLLRGAATYTPIFDYAIGAPFYELNRLYYGPLCLAIAAAMAVLKLRLG